MRLREFDLRPVGLVVLLMLSAIQAVPQEPAPDRKRNAERSVVIVRSDTASGTGVLLTSTGIVISTFSTLHHASRVTITTYNGETYDTVTLLALDRLRNLAIVKIDGHELPFVELSKSTQPKSGDSVTALGYSFKDSLPTLFSEQRTISSFANDDDSIQFTPPATETGGSVIVGPNGKVIGLLVPAPSGGQPAIATSKYLKQVLNSVDQTRPIFQWRGPGATFNKKPLVGISGYWKSSNGNVYLVEDKGDQVNITNMSSPKFRYKARWEEDLLIGIGYNDDTKRFVLRVSNPDHLLRAVFKFETKDTKETVIQKARQELKKPDDLWIRIH